MSEQPPIIQSDLDPSVIQSQAESMRAAEAAAAEQALQERATAVVAAKAAQETEDFYTGYGGKYGTGGGLETSTLARDEDGNELAVHLGHTMTPDNPNTDGASVWSYRSVTDKDPVAKLVTEQGSLAAFKAVRGDEFISPAEEQYGSLGMRELVSEFNAARAPQTVEATVITKKGNIKDKERTIAADPTKADDLLDVLAVKLARLPEDAIVDTLDLLNEGSKGAESATTHKSGERDLSGFEGMHLSNEELDDLLGRISTAIEHQDIRTERAAAEEPDEPRTPAPSPAPDPEPTPTRETATAVSVEDEPVSDDAELPRPIGEQDGEPIFDGGAGELPEPLPEGGSSVEDPIDQEPAWRVDTDDDTDDSGEFEWDGSVARRREITPPTPEPLVDEPTPHEIQRAEWEAEDERARIRANHLYETTRKAAQRKIYEEKIHPDYRRAEYRDDGTVQVLRAGDFRNGWDQRAVRGEDGSRQFPNVYQMAYQEPGTIEEQIELTQIVEFGLYNSYRRLVRTEAAGGDTSSLATRDDIQGALRINFDHLATIDPTFDVDAALERAFNNMGEIGGDVYQSRYDEQEATRIRGPFRGIRRRVRNLRERTRTGVYAHRQYRPVPLPTPPGNNARGPGGRPRPTPRSAAAPSRRPIAPPASRAATSAPDPSEAARRAEEES